MSVQYGAVASQKFTWPGVTGLLPLSAVAVRVIALPDDTIFDGIPAEVIANVIVVAAALAARPCTGPIMNVKTHARRHTHPDQPAGSCSLRFGACCVPI
jgi:hypothetical protein